MKVKTIIFGGKQLQIGTYKPPIMIRPEIACTLIRKTPKLRSWSKTDITLKAQKIAVNQAKFILLSKKSIFSKLKSEDAKLYS